MKILLIDQNYSFTTDIESRMILSDDFETEIITLNNVDETQAKLKMFSPDRIVLNADILQYYPDWDYNIPVTCYARNADTLKLAAEKGISCYHNLLMLSIIIQLSQFNRREIEAKLKIPAKKHFLHPECHR